MGIFYFWHFNILEFPSQFLESDQIYKIYKIAM